MGPWQGGAGAATAGVRRKGAAQRVGEPARRGSRRPRQHSQRPITRRGSLVVWAHIASLAILSFVFIFTAMLGSSIGGIGLGLVFSVPLAAAISVLEIIVVLVQAYVFALLTAVFIGMAIHAHH